MLTRGERLYRFALRDLAQPALHALTGRDFTRHRRFLEESQWWSAERLRDLQWQELMRLLRHAWDTIPYYRERWTQAGAEPGDIRTWEDFARLPVLTKADIRANLPRFRSTAVRGPLIPFSTGGSTGAPLHFEISRAGWDWRAAALERAWGWAGALPGTRTLMLWGAPLERQPLAARLRNAMFRGVRRELMISTFSQTEALWRDVYARAGRFQPRVLAGYAASLEQYLLFLVQHGKRHPSLRAAVSAAEAATPRLRQLCATVLQVPLFETYSAREFFNIASECEQHAGLHISAENLVVEIEGGGSETGDLLITDLRNDGMPLIRYRIEDGGAWARRSCACGRGLPMLRQVEGRLFETITGPSGRIVPGEFFSHLLLNFRSVRQFQAVQHGPLRVELRLVLDEQLKPAELETIRLRLHEVLGVESTVAITVCDSLPLLPSGKRQVTLRLPG